MLWRSPGTPVFTAPECCQGTTKIYRLTNISIKKNAAHKICQSLNL